MTSFGKLLIVIGVVLIIVGLLSNVIGKLPGDFSFKKGNVSIYFPFMTSIIISIVLSIILYIISRFR
ncbi:hypothetical protein Pryu01_00652 [Paraliobacillus ryukyuensis]|uniref:DUF2905 family protein n=1 Tax=Paraliobacillus ryukyuensis TaxID=200904 RepID=A0A366EFW7_9BACI|nr:DUF2905 domain-containing protein [Paraliobacillus ryukyuensis]RBP01282.1 DUF2905 family protein [Paraliobacillus ryukyuensis]